MKSTINPPAKSVKSLFQKTAPLLAFALALVLPALPGRAIDVDFNAGYSLTGGAGGEGNLRDQPASGTRWTGGANNKLGSIAIAANDGVGGKGQAARTQPGSEGANYAVYRFTPTDADLGAHFDPSSSVINYSFQMKLNGEPNAATQPIIRISFDKVVYTELLTNGFLSAANGDGNGKSHGVYSRAADGSPWHAPANTYFTVSGSINFATKTYTLSIDGVPQTFGGNPNLGFHDNKANTVSMEIVNLCSNIPDWIPVSIDKIRIAAVGGSAPGSAPLPVPSIPAATVTQPALPPIADGVNMIKNPSFENPPKSYFWLQNNWARNEVEFALDSDNPHSGKVSQRVTLKHAIGDRAALELNYPALPVRSGMSLKLSFWLRGPANTLPLTVQVRKAHTPYKTYFQAEVALTDAWTQSTFTMVLPPGVDEHDTTLIFSMREENTFWIDDVVLTPFTPPVQPPLVGNQVKNGSFEVGRDHWYAGIREAKDRGMRNNVHIEAEPEESAPDGRKVLGMDLPMGCQIQLTSAYFPLRSGHPVSIRFWLKSPADKTIFRTSLGQGHFPNQVALLKTFTSAGTGWSFYHFTATPGPSSSGSYYLEFDLDHPGKYALDGVSVTEGDSADQSFPASSSGDVGWGLPPNTPAGNLFYPKDKISFPLEVAAAPGKSAMPVHLRLVDYREREMNRWDVSVPLDAKGEGQTDVTLPSDRQGGFKVEAYLGDYTPETVPQTELIYSVVPRLKPPAEAKDSFFGAHVMMTPYNLDIAERLGFRWLRLHPPLSTKWMMVEPEKGKFDFYTAGVAYAYKRGFHLLSLFDTAPWFYADAPDVEAAKKSNWFTSFAPADWGAWRTYVQKTAAAFGPYIHDWEIWNEPDGGFLRVPAGKDKPAVYVKILTETRKALDEIGMHFNLVGNCVADLNRPFTIQELKLGGGSQVDALSFHLYTEDRSPDEKKPPLVDQLEAMRQFKNRSGKIPDLWHTEGGIWLDNGRSWLRSAGIPVVITTTVADAANSTVRTMVALKALGVRRFFFYGAFAEPSGGLVYRHTGAMVDVNGIPHAGGAAYAAAVSLLETADPDALEVKPVGEEKVTLAKFHTSDSRITVLWTRTPLDLGTIPGLDWKGASCFDMMGNPLDLSAQTKVTIDPIYLVTKGSAPASR